uniref:Chromosome 12 open reading frame 56 n=1 Tax=Vombatus ursinus TaxID=29139 RepID=A0A4X2MCQ1_VOMUR
LTSKLPSMGFPCRRNSRLDSFLKRHLRQEVYDTIRAYELCIVVSDTEHRTLKYAVLSDKLIYLTENPPRSIRGIVALKDVLAIDLIDDYPDFLNGPDREINQHIRIVYSLSTLKNSCGNVKGARKLPFPFPHLKVNKKDEYQQFEFKHGITRWELYHQESCSTMPSASALGHGSERTKLPNGDQNAFRTLPIPSKRSCSPIVSNGISGNSLSSVTNGTESILSYTANTKEFQTPSDQKNSQSEIQFKFSGNGNDFYSGNVASSVILPNNPNLEKKESELHLYIISTTSPMFLHLKSSWNNYMIQATLLQDSLYASKFDSTTGCQKPYRSEEMIKLFTQLKSELFLKDNTLGRIACLLAELKVAAQRNFIFRKLFWKTSDLYYFLVSKLHEYLPKPQDPKALQNKSQRADQLEACIQILQTLVLMFRETETELSRLNTLAAKKGTLITLLIILISEPEIPKSCPVFGIQFVTDSSLVEMSFDAELQRLMLEYTNTATALLYEILLVSLQGDLGLGSRKFAISWIMSLLQSFPPTISFVASIVKQVMKGLLMSLPLLSPGQAVLLYQQFYIIKSCLQHSSILAEYIRNNHKEEFRYFVHMPALEKRLPLCYPITQTTTKLIHEVLDLVEQEQCVKCS